MVHIGEISSVLNMIKGDQSSYSRKVSNFCNKVGRGPFVSCNLLSGFLLVYLERVPPPLYAGERENTKVLLGEPRPLRNGDLEIVPGIAG